MLVTFYALLEFTVPKTFHLGFVYSTEEFLNTHSLPAHLKNKVKSHPS